jgi:hypothetical protein
VTSRTAENPPSGGVPIDARRSPDGLSPLLPTLARPHGAGAGRDPSLPGRIGFRSRRLIVLAALLTGATLRLLQFAAERSLWLDEALLSESILSRGLDGLLGQPLEYGQTAPAGFLVIQKLTTGVLGTGEHALRLMPFLASVAALLLAPRLARRHVSRSAVPIAVVLFAIAPFAIYYGGEAKPYSVDLLAAVGLLLAGERVRRRPSGAALAVLAGVGVVALWVSQPAVLMAGGIGMVLGARAYGRGGIGALRPLVAVGAAWALAFVPAYVLSLRSMTDPEYMRTFWRSGFPDGPSWWLLAPLRLFREPFGAFGEDPTPLSHLQQGAAAVAFVLGCVWMVRRKRTDRLALLLAPALLALVAAALRLYPLGGAHTSAGRLLLFLLPALVLLVSEGVAAAARALPRPAGTSAAAGLSMALLASPLLYAAVQVPHLRAEVHPLLAYAAEERAPGDLLYVHYTGRAPFRYYAARYGWSRENSVIGRCSRVDPRVSLDELAGLRPARLWVVFNDDRATATHDDRATILAYLEHRGRRLDDQVTIGAALYLYDLTGEPGRPGDFRLRLPAAAEGALLGCRGPFAEADD